MRWISTRSSDDVRSERRAWTTASLAVYSAAAVLLLSSSSSSSSSSPFADAFSSSPRPCRADLLPSSAKASAFHGVGTTLPEVVRHGRRIAVSASSSDGDVGGGGEEEEEEEEENELDTESSTTGLFIPGFSDKFAPPDPPAPDQPRAAPPAVVVAKKAAVEPPVKKQQEKKKRNVSLPEEVSRSIIELPSMPKLSLPSLPFPPFGGEREKKRAPTPPSRPPPRTSSEEESLASALGGLVVGSGLGLYADVASDILTDTDLPAIVPPAFLGFALGAGAYLGAGRSDIVGSAVRLLFGGPVLRLRDAIVGGIRRKVDEIRATPGRIVDAVERKIDETVDEILATPGKIKDAAVERIDETVDEIKVRQ